MWYHIHKCVNDGHKHIHHLVSLKLIVLYTCIIQTMVSESDDCQLARSRDRAFKRGNSKTKITCHIKRKYFITKLKWPPDIPPKSVYIMSI